MKNIISAGILYLQIFVSSKEEHFNNILDAACLQKLGDGASLLFGKPHSFKKEWNLDGYLEEDTDMINFENMSQIEKEYSVPYDLLVCHDEERILAI